MQLCWFECRWEWSMGHLCHLKIVQYVCGKGMYMQMCPKHARTHTNPSKNTFCFTRFTGGGTDEKEIFNLRICVCMCLCISLLHIIKSCCCSSFDHFVYSLSLYSVQSTIIQLDAITLELQYGWNISINHNKVSFTQTHIHLLFMISYS